MSDKILNPSRQVISILRGEFVQVPVASAYRGDTFYQVIANGYANYPEPQYFSIRKNGTDVRNAEGQLISEYDAYELLRDYVLPFYDEGYTRVRAILVHELENCLAMWELQCDSL
jgi:hypothetical protein